MRSQFKLFFLSLFSIIALGSVAQQTDGLKLNPEKVKKLTPVLEHRHGGVKAFADWKAVNKLQYANEMWYFTESFYIKENQFPQGEKMNISGLDITRFENQRSKTEEVTITIPGYKDVLVLLPENKLLYKLP